MKRLCLVLAFLTAPAFAQQQLTPEQNVASLLGSQLGICMQNGASQQTEVAKLKARVKELEDKYESNEKK